MTRFFRCKKCHFQFMATEEMARNNLKCGAAVQYLYADDADAGNDGIIQSVGIKPIGCGGEIQEVSLEEAMNHVEE